MYKINEILALIDYCMDLKSLRGRAKWANVLHVTPLYLFLETWVGTFCEIKDMLWGTHAMLQLSKYICMYLSNSYIHCVQKINFAKLKPDSDLIIYRLQTTLLNQCSMCV